MRSARRARPLRPIVRKVLFLAYYFPPHGGGGVQRSVSFCRLLPRFGYEPIVVTGPGFDVDGWGPPDETLNGRVSPGATVIRLPGSVPPPSSGWRNRVERLIRRPDRFDRWWLEGVTAAGRDAGRDSDLVYASMSPFGTAEAAARIAAHLGKPWVADLRDPWALDEWRVYTSSLHRRLEVRRMRRALASADAVVMNTPEAVRALLDEFPEFEGKRVVTIPNGYSEADFEDVSPKGDPAAFRIVHAGAVHLDGGSPTSRFLRRFLGGQSRGLDVSTRSHRYLLRAVSKLLSARPELARTLEVHLAGALPAGDLVPLPAGVVRARGFLPHREATALLRSADLLFLPMHDLPAGVRSRLVPGKTYEYLASRTPILAAVPDGDARDLLAAAGNAFLCGPKDVDGMARVIEEQVARVGRGEPAPTPRESVVARYERGRLTAELAELFDQVLRPASEDAPEPVRGPVPVAR